MTQSLAEENYCSDAEVKVKLPTILTLTLDGAKWSASPSGHFTCRERAPGSHCIEMGGPQNRSGSSEEEKDFFPCPEWNSCLPAHSPSLSRHFSDTEREKGTEIDIRNEKGELMVQVGS
jgi:hypothetical protein